MTTGQITKFSKGKGYESIPRDLLQNNNLSLEAIGLLCYMQSLPDNWKLYKTQLYTQFPNNKRSVIDRIWKELTEHKYLLNFKKREGKKYVYNYIFSVIPFSAEDIAEIKKEQNNNNFWDVDFQQSNLNSSKSTPIKLTNKKLTKNKSTKTENIINDDEINKIIKKNPEVKDLAKELVNTNISTVNIIKILDYFLTNSLTISIPIVKQQLEWMYNKSHINSGISDHFSYFIHGYIKRIDNVMYDKTSIPNQLPYIPMYNWITETN